MIILYTGNFMGQYALMYAYELAKDTRPPYTIEYLYDNSLPCFDYVEHNVRKNMHAICLGEGLHRVPYKGGEIEVRSEFSHQTRLTGDIVNKVTLNAIRCADSAAEIEFLSDFLNDAKEWVEKYINDIQCQSGDTIKKFLFDPKEQSWDLLNVTRKRKMDSVFLPCDVKQKLMSFVQHFVSPEGKADYHRFNMPYKCNILLYGLPGTGKTSCIHALASELGSDIGIIHFNNPLDDLVLTRAINKLADLKAKCRVLVFEDIDSLFTDDRKKHDSARNAVSLSGLLNNLDGLSRNEGTIVIMTTNRRDVLDEALLRSSRVDLQIEFCNATEDQIERMFNYYFPGREAEGAHISKKLAHRSYTMSMLQEFFFTVRNDPNVSNRLEVLEKIRKRNTSQSETDKSKSLYM